MGLPLFVAKVESDIPHKCARKSRVSATTASPPRTNIRRIRGLARSRDPHRVDRIRREFDREARRTSALEQNDRSIRGTAGHTPPPPGFLDPDDGDDGREPPSRSSVADYISRRFFDEDGMDDEQRESRRTICISWFQRFFGHAFHTRDWNRSQRDAFGNYWIMERPTRTRVARIVRLGSPSPEAPDIARSIDIVPASSWPRVPSWLLELAGDPLRSSVDSGADRGVGSRSRYGSLYPDTSRLRSRISAVPESERPRRIEDDGIEVRILQPWTFERAYVADGAPDEPWRASGGLGDRVHSPSPETWDTLQSTLTPDPQPPSADSSFVSTAASQSATASSNTSIARIAAQTARAVAATSPQDGPCESDSEASDPDEASESEHPFRYTPRPARPSMRHGIAAPSRASGELRNPRRAVPRTSYVRHTMPRGAENVSLMFRANFEEAHLPSDEEIGDEYRAHIREGPLPGYSAVVQATRADAPEADDTEPPRASFHRRWSVLTPIMDRLNNNEDVPDELWAAAGVGLDPPWARENPDRRTP